jgi:hypothetical protein
MDPIATAPGTVFQRPPIPIRALRNLRYAFDGRVFAVQFN